LGSLGPQTGPESTPNDPDRFSDILTLHQVEPLTARFQAGLGGMAANAETIHHIDEPAPDVFLVFEGLAVPSVARDSVGTPKPPKTYKVASVRSRLDRIN
jgi:hypothetical protein